MQSLLCSPGTLELLVSMLSLFSFFVLLCLVGLLIDRWRLKADMDEVERSYTQLMKRKWELENMIETVTQDKSRIFKPIKAYKASQKLNEVVGTLMEVMGDINDSIKG